MANRLITIATFTTPVEAHLARNVLRAEGIDSFVADENMVSLGYGTTALYGGVKLQVLETYAARAAELLSQAGDGFADSAQQDDSFLVEDETATRSSQDAREAHSAPPSNCPQCLSSAIFLKPPPWPVRLLSILLLGIPHSLARSRWTCRVCHAQWDAD